MAEQASYQVRTPPSYWAASGIAWGLAAVPLAAVTFMGLSVVWIAAVVLFVAVAISFTTGTAYRIGAHRNVIRFYADRLEVPHASRRARLVFARDGLQVTLQSQVVRVRFLMLPLGDLTRGTLIELRGGGMRRKLSTLVLADPADVPFLLADLRRVAAGEPAIGRTAPGVQPRTEYDDQLDRELAEME